MKIKAVLLAAMLVAGTAASILTPLYNAHAAPYDYTQTDSIGTPVTLSNPYGFYIDSAGNYYMADGDAYLIKKISPTGQLLLTFGPGDWSDLPEEFGWVEGIAVKSNGEIYVSDGENLRIQVYSAAGQYLRTIGSGVFDNYNGKLTFDSADNLYVSDYDTVRVFNSSDNQILSFGTSGTADGQFSGIGDLDVDTNGDMYVLDRSGARVSVFDAAGTFLRKFGSYTSSWTGPPEQFQFPNSISIHPDGNLRIADRARVKTFDKNGNYISLFGSDGYQSGAFNNLQHLEISADGNIHTIESGADRIQKFTAAGSYLLQFGNEGSDDSQFFGPLGIDTDSSDNIYVVDSVNNRIQKFASNGTFIREWGTIGTGDGQFHRPRSIAVDSTAGRVYVTEWRGAAYSYRVQIFDLDGNYISKFGSKGTGDGQFNGNTSVTVGPSGTVYVADSTNLRVQVFDSNGVFLYKWSVTGNPYGIGVDASENIYVVTNSSYIYKYTSAGALLATYGTAAQGSADGQFSSPNDIIIDADGVIYVADPGNHRIQIFNADGTFMKKFGTEGDGLNQLMYPQSLALDSNMRLVIADDVNNRIPIYSLGVPATAPSEPQTVTVDTAINNEATVNWSAPADDGGAAITDYILEYKPSASSSWTTVSVTPPTVSHTINSLPAGQYDVRLSATNSAGTSPITAPVSFTVTDPPAPATTPSQPQNVTTEVDVPNKIKVKWSVPASDGGDPVTNYKVEHKKSSEGASSWIPDVLDGTAREHIINNVQSGCHDVRVSATNSQGYGTPTFVGCVTVIDPAPAQSSPEPTPTPSASSPATDSSVSDTTAGDDSTVSTTEEQQSSVTILPIDDPSAPGSILISWESPTNTTTPPSGYVIEYRDSDTPASDTTTPWQEIANVDADKRSATITLPPGEYNVRVAALIPGEVPTRVILGVAKVTISSNLIEGDASGVAATVTPKPTDNILRNWVIGCAAVVAATLLFIIPIAWKRRRKKAQFTSVDLPPRRLQ